MNPAGRLLRDHERKLTREIPRAMSGDVEGIHQLRVTSRRLRLALSVLPRKPQSKRVTRARRGLRTLTRAASASRDLDVSCETYERRCSEMPQASAEARTLLTRLKAARRRSRAGTADKLLDTEVARLRRDLRAVLKQGVAPGDSLALRMRRRAAQVTAVLLAGVAELGDRFDAVALHALRRRVRQLRYVSDLADELFAAPARAARRFRQMQDELGELHDLHVLAIWLGARAEAALKKGEDPLASAAASEAGWAEGEARARHRAWLAGSPAARINEALNELLAGIPVQEPANDAQPDVTSGREDVANSSGDR